MLFKFLKQPYPLEESPVRRWLFPFGMGLFVFLFLFLFRPFGLQRFYSHEVLPISLAYGLTTFLILLFHSFLFPKILPFLFKDAEWTVGKELLWVLFIVSTIGLGNVICTNILFKSQFTFNQLLWFQFSTLLIALFPITFLVLLKQNRLLKKNLEEAKSITEKMYHKKRLESQPGLMVTLQAENPKDNFSIEADKVLFITSADNYIEVHYLEEEAVRTRLIRSTLKSARENLRFITAFYRCHRAYIVNLDQVESVNGNAQGYRLRLNHTEIQPPVSRNLNNELRQRLCR